ncbi:hypothetical protein [Agaribacter marinus]|uniref:DUF4402 domain-containing protein n=1 Tax=Agaribacter marinus TaxID=1431249 RepID=A0AA37WK75_9ALTE|nr:hypothetical protein [Agaribacter marinus]GLR70715.1 hypothetical protein GCM10007852_16230 [Agaribacter marinus]
MEEINTMQFTTKFKSLSTILLLWTTWFVNAQQPSDIIEITPLNFGDITAESGSICTLNMNGDISGSCDASSADISVGRIQIENLPKNSEFFLTISGNNSSALSLNVSGQVTAASVTTAFTDSEQLSIRSRGSNNVADIIIAGELTTTQGLSNGQNYQVGYTISIEIQ